MLSLVALPAKYRMLRLALSFALGKQRCQETSKGDLSFNKVSEGLGSNLRIQVYQLDNGGECL